MLYDLRLPGISGKDLITRVRKSPKHAAMPLIMVSASDSIEIEESGSCAPAGANAFMSRQRSEEDPIEVIKHIIGYWTSAQLAG